MNGCWNGILGFHNFLCVDLLLFVVDFVRAHEIISDWGFGQPPRRRKTARDNSCAGTLWRSAPITACANRLHNEIAPV